MKYIKEYAFWNKDSDIAQKILNNLVELKSSDIEHIEVGLTTTKYVFNIKGFNVSVEYDFNKYMVTGGYTVKVDNIKIDISCNQGRKIYNRARKIYNRDKKEEEEYIKKDARISL